MEYEIYLACNILGILILFIIFLFHFIENDKDAAKALKKEYQSDPLLYRKQ